VPLSQPPRWLFALQGVLAAVVVVALVRLADPAEVRHAVATADLRLALLALALVPVNIGLETYRWWRLVRRLAPEVRYTEALRAVVGSYPLGLLTPGRVGDYVGRTVFLRAIPGGASAALTFGERMATLAACLAGGLLALKPFLDAQVAPSPLWAAVTGAGLVATGALVASILFPSLMRATLGTLLPFEPVRRAARAFDAIPQEEGAALLALSALRYVVFSTQFVLLVHALAPGVPMLGSVVAVALVFFSKSAIPQITLGDLGIREGAAVYFLAAYGVDPAAALDASLGLFALNLVLPSLVGVPLLLRLQLRRQPAGQADERDEPGEPAPARVRA